MTIYLLIGPTGAGKTTALNYLKEKGYAGVESSDHVKDLQRINNCKDAYQLIAKIGKTEAGIHIARRVEDELRGTAKIRRATLQEMPAAISGLRITSSIDYFTPHYPVEFIGLYASEELLFEQHKRPGRQQYATVEDFVTQKLEPDYQLGLREIMEAIPEHRRITVDGNLRTLLDSIDKLTS